MSRFQLMPCGIINQRDAQAPEIAFDRNVRELDLGSRARDASRLPTIGQKRRSSTFHTTRPLKKCAKRYHRIAHLLGGIPSSLPPFLSCGAHAHAANLAIKGCEPNRRKISSVPLLKPVADPPLIEQRTYPVHCSSHYGSSGLLVGVRLSRSASGREEQNSSPIAPKAPHHLCLCDPT